MDLNSESSGDEKVANDECVILDVSQPKAVRKRRRRKRLTPAPKKHKWATPSPAAAAATEEPSLRLLDAVAVEPQPSRPTRTDPEMPRQKKRSRRKEERESDAAASNSESEREDDTKEGRAIRRVIRRNREAITCREERKAFDALPEHQQFRYTPKRKRTAPERLHIKTNKGRWGNLHRSYDKPHAEDVDEKEGLAMVRNEFGGSPKSTSSWHDTDDDHVEAEEDAPAMRGSGESMAPLRSDEGWLSVSPSHYVNNPSVAKPPKKKKKNEPSPGKRKLEEPPMKTSSSGMRSPPGIVYNAFLVRPEGKPAITIPRFTLPDGRSTRQAQVSWIPVRYLEMLLFSRYDGGTTGAVFKMLQRIGLGPTSWVIGSPAVTRGEISHANAEFIIYTFRELLPSRDDPLLGARTRVVTLIPVASAVTICRERGRSPESMAFLRTFAPREVLPLPTTGPLEPPAKHLQSADDDSGDDEEENVPLSKRPKATEPALPPPEPAAPPAAPPAVAKASWRVQQPKPPAPVERGNSWTSTLAAQTLTSLAGELFGTAPATATPIVTGAPVESDQDSNATERYGALPHPNLDELIRMPRSLQLPTQPPPFPPPPPPPIQRSSSTTRTTTTTTETTTVNHSRPHSLKWETKSSLELAEAARRELEAQARRAPAKRAPYFFDPKFKSTKLCRYGNECKFRNAGCAFVHPNDQKKLEDKGSTSRMPREPYESTKHEKHGKHNVDNYVWRPPLENRGFTKNTFRLENRVERDSRGNVLRPFHETDRF